MALYGIDGVTPTLPASGRFWIAPTAAVIGRVTLEEDASVWFGAVARGDNDPIVIGAGSNVQDNCVLHTDPGFPLTLGAGVTIGHMVTLHGCTVGDNSLIGMGATILNGARIGKNVIVGANALVPEGKEIPDNSLAVGAPARVVRSIDAKGEAELRRAALIYVEKWQRYAQGLSELS